MKVILSETYGFCGGVRKAVNLIYSELDKDSGENILMEGPIIHNNNVINDLKSKGVKLLNDTSKLEGKKVVVRAHGITPLIEKDITQKGGIIVDGTCPIVKKSQIMIKKYAEEGYFIVIAGDKGHAEVIGLVGQAPSKCCVVANPQDLNNFIYPQKTLLLCQTTFSKPEFFEIEKVLLKKCPTLKTICTICGATNERQEAVIDLAKKVDAVIVVGGLTSSNTKRLMHAVEEIVPVWLVEDSMGLPEQIKKYQTVGVTAGASTPDNVINEVVRKLESL